jgi:proteasome lid subunit RPN8/RPN11
MTLSKTNKEAIKSHAVESAPNECCGLILDSLNRVVTERCANISSSPEKNCLIKLSEIKEKAKRRKILAIYHSHSSGLNDFSWEDKAVSENRKINLVLYCLETDEFKFYKPNGYIAPFSGRNWSQGIFTCISIVEDYYKKNFNVDIIGYEDSVVCGEKIKYIDITALFIKSLKNKLARDMIEGPESGEIWPGILSKSGFHKVKDFQKHDVITCRGLDEKWNKRFNLDYAIHAAIYLGDGKILHHPYRRKSLIQKMDKDFKLSICEIYRRELNTA